jgi:UDPglucose 6-dehydrogenase
VPTSTWFAKVLALTGESDNISFIPEQVYGGSCFPKDVKALIKTAKGYGYNLRVLTAVEDVNEDQKSILVRKMNTYFNYDLKGKTIAIWGLSFKPNTDDMREAPSRVIIAKLLEAGAKVRAYDPVSLHEAERIFNDSIEFAKDQYDALVDADALVIVTEWSEFKFPNFRVIKKLLKTPVVFDGRNIYDAKEMKNDGFDYFCIGINTNK